MTEAKLAPNLPGWMLEHTNRYLSSGGTDGLEAPERYAPNNLETTCHQPFIRLKSVHCQMPWAPK